MQRVHIRRRRSKREKRKNSLSAHRHQTAPCPPVTRATRSYLLKSHRGVAKSSIPFEWPNRAAAVTQSPPPPQTQDSANYLAKIIQPNKKIFLPTWRLVSKRSTKIGKWTFFKSFLCVSMTCTSTSLPNYRPVCTILKPKNAKSILGSNHTESSAYILTNFKFQRNKI